MGSSVSSTYGLMVARNEADRYLESSLAHNAPLVDGLLVFDDWSTDSTKAIAKQYAYVASRPRSSLSFVEHEGMFRRSAWEALVEQFNPSDGDVIVAVDADEYLMGDIEDFEGNAARVSVDESWGLDGRTPLIRTDRYWGNIDNVRVWRWSEDLFDRDPVWSQRKTASGCGPFQAAMGHHPNLRILHVGYLHPDDREAKYLRYSNDKNHGSAHVRSIRSTPKLKKYKPKPPHIYRGSTAVERGLT